MASSARRNRPSSLRFSGWLRRAIFLTHRWLGVGLALVMALWCLSGFVMMYVAYPNTSRAERMAGLAPLDMAGCCTSSPVLDGAALEDVDSAAIEMLAGRPVLRVGTSDGEGVIDLQTGARTGIGANLAEQVAQTHLQRTTGHQARWTVAESEPDQWTVSGFARHAPLYKATADDEAGTVLYVSGVTGAVVQDTTRSERFWNWLGAIPHWLYFKQLRENGPLWSQIVIYASLLGTFLTALGIYIGIARLKPGKRWIPYRGADWWHHVTGLIFGLVTLTWVASGLMSMNPWGLLDSDGPGAEVSALAARGPNADDVRALVQAVSAASLNGAVRAELSIQGGRPYAIVSEPSGLRWRASLPDIAAAPLDAEELDSIARRARPGVPAATAMIHQADAYHYGHHRSVVLPAWRVIYQDEGQTRFYFDPRTGELLSYADPGMRKSRWLHSALHSFDFTPLLRSRPVWDVVMLPLLAGASAVCLVGLWLGGRRVGRTIQRRRMRLKSARR